MGRIGLTEKQEETLADLKAKPKLTEKQAQMLADLEEKAANPQLPATLTSYLKEWYAEQLYGNREEISTKYTAKGHMQEQNALNMIARVKGLGILKKNTESRHNGFIKGTKDASKNGTIFDSKCSWSAQTLLDVVVDGLKPEYYLQMQGYMELYDMEHAEVWHLLLDTPAEVNYGRHVDWESLPESMRYVSFSIDRDRELYAEIEQRVLLCRKWLEDYHQVIAERLWIKNQSPIIKPPSGAISGRWSNPQTNLLESACE